ncbi:polysaccharide pyruvyl transferase family protein [Microbacterium sp. 10M-3C3]|uniref:polysaccharide pyruvyl transferase family protein n=1 Tax=Microbacterium sp. 10M-3C3 TaxID=2483401 RepID=UPI0013DDB875|nr:polysaccharide pyruvyl transferase family protein [Microbacterium sp. 10M-3C3]
MGDAELVRLTIDAAIVRFGATPTVLATHPSSFEDDADFVYKPLSREIWRSRSGLPKLRWLSQEASRLLFVAAVPFIPKRLRDRAVRAVLRRSKSPWLRALTSASIALAVGGGYLGDRYLRESLVSLLSYRYCIALGAQVETMPLSISSARHPLLRLALLSTKGVRWRARDATTQNILIRSRAQPELVPDLAWLDTGVQTHAENREGICIAPVGSSFYADKGEPLRAWQAARHLIERLDPQSTVRLVPMHRWSAALGDGGDDLACDRLETSIREMRPDLRVIQVRPTRYSEVRDAMAASEFAVCERLHAALAAATSGTRALILGYEPKHLGVMTVAGLERLCGDLEGALSVEPEEIESKAKRQRALVEAAVL